MKELIFMNMFSRKTASLLLAAMSAAVLCSCGEDASGNSTTVTAAVSETTSATEEYTLPPEAAEYTLYADLTRDFRSVSDKFEISGGWSNGSMFNCTWKNENCVFEDGKMYLIIDNDPTGTDIPYSGGEFRTKDFYSFGYYEVTMKPITNDGVVSSFFTYTGPSDNNPWDEIDIEFLGKDTTKVQFNYFTNGKGNHEYLYDLGFNAAEEFHDYGFDWQPDSITWYVDGEAVYTATENIPQTPGKIMMNAWPGIGVRDWLNEFDGNVPLKAEYLTVKYKESEE